MLPQIYNVKKSAVILLSLAVLMLLSAPVAVAQTTAFTYQGRLTDGVNLANGQYDFQFKLFNMAAVGTGTQLGTTQLLSPVTVTNGVFTVNLDFGACPTCFNGSARFLEIAVKLTSGSTFTTLSPRQPITSTPYAINAAQLGGLAASGFLQNQNGAAQTGNFNISGNGTAGGTLSGSIVNATTQYNINGLRAFTVNGPYNFAGTFFTATNTFAGDGAGLNTTPSTILDNGSGKFNAFFGAGAGQANTIGFSNSFFGWRAGTQNTTGINNAFFGNSAGFNNTTGGNNAFFGASAGLNNNGDDNAFFGRDAGQANIGGSQNAFFGSVAGTQNTSGQQNAFFGNQAGFSNTTGFQNAFFGYGAGFFNTGQDNAFFGTLAGHNNTTGTNNTFIGNSADFTTSNPPGDHNTLLGALSRATSGISNATAIGFGASVTQSNTLILGGITGVNNGTSVMVGIGTTAPDRRLTVIDPSNTGFRVQTNTAGGRVASFGGLGDFDIDAPGIFGGRFTVKENGNVGIGMNDPTVRLQVAGNALLSGNLTVNSVTVNSGFLTLALLGGAGTTQLCRNAANQVSSCSSSLRYKTNLAPFGGGLSLVNRLRPITFTWKANGEADLGLAAEDVAKVEPLLVTHNEKGEIEGVKYDRVTVVLLNAVKEQQTQITTQQTQIAAQQTQLKQQAQQMQNQQREIEDLKRLVRSLQPQAEGHKVRARPDFPTKKPLSKRRGE